MDTSGLETSGLETSGFETSGLKTTTPVSPSPPGSPAGAEISATFTVTGAFGTLDVMKTGREMLERGASETSTVVSGSGWPTIASRRKDALPPTGWLAIVRR